MYASTLNFDTGDGTYFYNINFGILEGSLLVDAARITWQSIRIKLCGKANVANNVRIRSIFDYAKKENGGSFEASLVEKIKPLGHVIPVFVLIILYWTVYFQVIIYNTYDIQNSSLLYTQNFMSVNIQNVIQYHLRKGLVLIRVTKSLISTTVSSSEIRRHIACDVFLCLSNLTATLSIYCRCKPHGLYKVNH